jgi:hypothetical protein
MSSAGGLSRRRVAGASSSNSDDTPNPGSLPNGSSPNGTIATHAGSAFEGGSKIAYDPRDLDQVQEDSRYGGRMPRLTIMEEVLLLGLKDKHVRMAFLLHFILSLCCPPFFACCLHFLSGCLVSAACYAKPATVTWPHDRRLLTFFELDDFMYPHLPRPDLFPGLSLFLE